MDPGAPRDGAPGPRLESLPTLTLPGRGSRGGLEGHSPEIVAMRGPVERGLDRQRRDPAVQRRYPTTFDRPATNFDGGSTTFDGLRRRLCDDMPLATVLDRRLRRIEGV